MPTMSSAKDAYNVLCMHTNFIQHPFEEESQNAQNINPQTHQISYHGYLRPLLCIMVNSGKSSPVLGEVQLMDNGGVAIETMETFESSTECLLAIGHVV